MPSGPHGPTQPPCASSTSTTLFSPPITRIRATPSSPSSPSRSRPDEAAPISSRGIAVAYEIHVALVKAISLHQFKKDHVAHLAPATTAGIGALLGLPVADHLPGGEPDRAPRLFDPPVAQGRDQLVEGLCAGLLRQARHRGRRSRHARRGVPLADLRGRGFRHRLDARRTRRPNTRSSLPAPGEPPRGILETYTKAHSAEYQAQALIDLAIELAPRIQQTSRPSRRSSSRPATTPIT